METFSAEKEEVGGERVSLSNASSGMDNWRGFAINKDRVTNC